MEVYLKDKLVEVKIIPKNNKNIYFRFDDDLNLVITANKRVKEKEIKKLIVKNEDSLARMLDKAKIKKEKEHEFWYLGKKYQVVVTNIDKVAFKDDRVFTPSMLELDKYVKFSIKKIFQEEVESLKAIITTPDFELKIRKMKTRWGVCNYKSKSITLNSELIKYRKELLRYVIVHEMCHFYHHDHSKDFWKLVEYYYPDYKNARKELRS